MPQLKKYNFMEVGIKSPLNLNGDLQTLRNEAGLPIVFLIDESHDNLNSCINKNIENAIELIKNADVRIIGVESRYGGKLWNEGDEEYEEENDNANDYKGGCTTFEDGLKEEYENYLFGVESFGIMSKIACSFGKGNGLDSIDKISDHHLNKLRSKHFIKTLFEHHQANEVKGNLLLNCGRDHNTHIEEWIKSGEIDEIANHRANYIRINTID
ncbi:MAG TPA: hypothetical protein VFF27_02420 [Bacteroidia bacterium]|jgi:predicted small secreted protein|nr:hypothetical protein [Bacteroidia bacterium]